MSNKPPIALFLFDLTGLMGQLWLEAGYEVWIVDIQHRTGIHRDSTCNRLVRVGADLRHGWVPPREIINRVVFMGAFPECTNVAVSGAAHFKRKGARALALSLDLFATSRELGDWLQVPYFIENPVSTFSTYCGKSDYMFNPSDYGGYLPENDRHPRWPEYIAARDAYPKKTCLWTGGGFKMPKPIPVPVPPGYSQQFKKLGGKSQKNEKHSFSYPQRLCQGCI